MSQDEATVTASEEAQGSGSAPSQPQGGQTNSSTPLISLPDELPGRLILGEKENVLATNDIYWGLWVKPGGERVPVTIKVIQKVRLPDERPQSLTVEERFKRRYAHEISIWKDIRHKNILPFIGYQLIDGAPLLVSEVCAHGDLERYISRNPQFPEAKRLALLRDATRGLRHLHSLQPPIAHGSIHPSDILVTHDFRGVLCDFGDSTVVSESPTGFTADLYSFHRVRFSSPELIMGITLPTPMSDVYGLGGTILKVMTGNDPFHQKRTPAQVVLAVSNGIVPSRSDHCEIPESLWRWMALCWKADPSQRPTAAQIVYKINLILDCGHGLTVPFRKLVVASSALPDPEEPETEPEEPETEPEESIPSLPSPLPGALKKDELIGGGGYGEVHRGFWTPPGKDPIPVAIKCLNMRIIGLVKAQKKSDFIRRIRRETVIWKAAEHPNILFFYGYQLVDEIPMLVSSWCKNGDLWSFLGSNSQLTRRERLQLLRGAGRGLSHLHSLQPPICHGDIKPQNVVISDNMEALLCDFGVSRVMADPGVTEMTTRGEATGTAGFGSKEVLEGEGPTKAGDVYAFGGLTLAAMTGKRPFYRIGNPNRIMWAIFRDETPNPADYPEISQTDALWSLMKQCWNPDPQKRPYVSQIVTELQQETNRPLYEVAVANDPVARFEGQGGGIARAQNTQEDSTIISSLYYFPDPLLGSLVLEVKERVGSYSDVYRGLWRYNGTERVVCIKALRNTVPHGDPARPDLAPHERFQRRVRREVGIWNALSHPNILPFFGYQVVDGEPRLVSPWMNQGNLNTYLENHSNLPMSDKLVLLEGVAGAVAYLHGLFPPIAHGDPKPENILITNEIRPVLCDTGNSRVMTDGHSGFTTSPSAVGSVVFQAKELILGESMATPMSDIYAMGGIILETMSRMRLFPNAQTSGAVAVLIITDQMHNPEDHPNLFVDDPLWPLLRQCWNPKPDERPRAVDLVRELNRRIDQHLPHQLEGQLRKIKRISGRGYSEVHNGAWTRSNGSPVDVAIKCIKMPYRGSDAETQTHFRERIGRELSVWELTKHENILEFFGHQVIDGVAMIVSPWCENGNLRQYIHDHPELTPIKKLELLCDAAQGLAHLHSRTSPIVHGDIKPDNIVVTKNIRGALCGFGTSRVIACFGTRTDWMSMGAGSPEFQAKELYEENALPTSMSDVYAFGGVILAAMSGKAPFYQIATRGWASIYQAIYNNETARPADHPELPGEDLLWRLMQNCWDAEPTQRPRIDQVVAALQHGIQCRSN